MENLDENLIDKYSTSIIEKRDGGRPSYNEIGKIVCLDEKEEKNGS